ncbi:hypothetical protein JCM3774_003147 [Rhodotorula dairenensis]
MQAGNIREPQELIVLAGVVGSGKSTLSQAWQRHLPYWVRVNQDDLGDRRTCEAAVRSALSQGRNVVVDRQNFDAPQRRTWLEIANEFPGVRVGGMVMGTPKDECRTRLLARTGHPTIDNPDLAVTLLEKFSGLWEEPRIDEGFDQLITLPPLPHADEIDATLIRSLLDLLHRSPTNPRAAAQRTPRPRSSPYARPDGFVDDGTWRPPPPLPPTSVPFRHQQQQYPPQQYYQDRAPAPPSSHGPVYPAAWGYRPPQASMPAWTRDPPAPRGGDYHRGPYPPPRPSPQPPATTWPERTFTSSQTGPSIAPERFRPGPPPAADPSRPPPSPPA